MQNPHNLSVDDLDPNLQLTGSRLDERYKYDKGTCQNVVQDIIHCERIQTDDGWLGAHLLAHLLDQSEVHRADIAQVLGDDYIRI